MSRRRARRAWAAACRKHFRPGSVVIVEIAHSQGCLIYSSERVCTCNAERTLRDPNERVLARVEGVGEYDPLEFGGMLR